VPNRSYTFGSGPATVLCQVLNREDLAGPGVGSPTSTAAASVSIISMAFAMPQLGRTRRVWLYLPPGYATSGRRYPVLYLQDGQNMFDAATAFAGECGVDEALLEISDAQGRAVLRTRVRNGQAVDVSRLAAGMYRSRLTAGSAVGTSKFTKE
jgi:S-formylglutathione hydrolase FrmB